MDSQILMKLRSLELTEEQLKSCIAVLNDLNTSGRNTVSDVITDSSMDAVGTDSHVCFLDTTTDEKCVIILPLYCQEVFTYGKLHSILDRLKHQYLSGRVTLAIVGHDHSVLYYELEMGVSLPQQPPV